jgi:uncharacterized protein
VRSRSPFVVDVRELLDAPGVRRSLTFDARIDDLATGLVDVAEALRLELVLEAMDGGILVQGAVAGSFAGSCRRCLGALRIPFEIRVAEVYRPKGAVWEEGYVVHEGTIDLERMARDVVGLEMPLGPLCRPDCAGLCPRCGADLNEGPCGCPAGEGDPRWSALRELGR